MRTNILSVAHVQALPAGKTGQAAKTRDSAHLLNIWLSLTGFDWHSHLPTQEASTPAAEDVLDAGAGAGAGPG